MSISEATIPDFASRRSELGPKGLPLLGNLPEIKRDALNFFVNLSREYGDIVPYRIGTDRIFLINHPEHIRYVLTINQANYGKGRYFAKAKPLMGEAMVMSDGDRWLALRRTALPGMQGRVLPRMAEGIVDAADRLIGRLQANAETGAPVDIAPEMTKLAMDVVFRTLFHVDLDYDADRILNALSSALGEIERRVWSVTPIRAHLPSKANREFRRNIRYLEDLIARMIEARRRDPAEHDDLLSIFMRATDDPENTLYTEKQLRDECMNFFLVGRDTAAGALMFTLYLLSLHPAVERKLRREIDTVLGGRRPGYKDVERLPYLGMVLEESLRLYPPGWTFSRMALDDDRIGGVDIPKGSTVQMCIYAMHRHPRFWDNPEGFDPERFSPERSEGRPQFAYFPFGGGGRICIGRKLAQMESALLIARLMQSYRFSLVPGQRIEMEPMIALRPKDGLKMAVAPAPVPDGAAATVSVDGGAAASRAAAAGCPFAAAEAG